MPDILFYQLLAKPLEVVLPDLLEKSLLKGWRAVVQGADEARLNTLDTALWTYRDDSFLPHGTKGDGHAEEQPVYLTTGPENPNGAAIRFLIDQAMVDNHADYQRIVYLFNGHDPEALTHARTRWKVEKAAGYDVAYWAENSSGRWEKKA